MLRDCADPFRQGGTLLISLKMQQIKASLTRMTEQRLTAYAELERVSHRYANGEITRDAPVAVMNNILQLMGWRWQASGWAGEVVAGGCQAGHAACGMGDQYRTWMSTYRGGRARGLLAACLGRRRC